MSSYHRKQEKGGLDSDRSNVYINSEGGEVAEGLAIYDSLLRHKAEIHTVCDGFACSAASVVFMAGISREMNAASLLMIHNAWTYAAGNAEDLRKTAEDLDEISATVKKSYSAVVNISEEELDELLADETWISPEAALQMGFATEIIEPTTKAVPSQCAQIGRAHV